MPIEDEQHPSEFVETPVVPGVDAPATEHIAIMANRAGNYYIFVPKEVEAELRAQSFDLDHGEPKLITPHPGPADVSLQWGGVIAAGSGVLVATIRAVVKYLTSGKRSGTIVIVGRDGSRVEAPGETARDDLDFYVQKAQEIGATQVIASNVMEGDDDDAEDAHKKQKKAKKQQKQEQPVLEQRRKKEKPTKKKKK